MGSGSISRRTYVLASLLWCAAALAVKPFFAYVDFGVFYSTALEKILAGAPLDLYAFVARRPGSDLAFPLCHPPIWLFYLSPWYALGRLFGIDDFQRQAGFSIGQTFVLVATLPFDVLLCRTVLRLAEGTKRLAEPGRFYLFLCLLLSPLLWLASVRYGHNESLLVLLVIAAVAAGEKGRPALSGLFWGLALGIKTTAVVPALVYYGWGLGRGRRRPTVTSAVVAATVFLLPLLPYVLFRREQIFYALLGFERVRPIGGHVLWKLFPDPAALAGSSTVVILGLSAALGLLLARRRGESFLAGGGAWALVLSQVFLLLFAKAVFVWYGLALCVFLYLAVAHERSWKGAVPVGPLAASLLLWLVQRGAPAGEEVSLGIRVRSAVWAVLLVGVAAVALGKLLRRDEATTGGA